jgi:hypothetical protein
MQPLIVAPGSGEAMLYTRSTCGKIRPSRHCPDHPPRDRVAQHRFRVAVLKRDAHRCRRCGSGTTEGSSLAVPRAAALREYQ